LPPRRDTSVFTIYIARTKTEHAPNIRMILLGHGNDTTTTRP